MTPTDAAVLSVIVENAGRIVSRTTIRRSVGLQHYTERRCDDVVSSLRTMLGDNAMITVCSRGWMLRPDAIAATHDLMMKSHQVMTSHQTF